MRPARWLAFLCVISCSAQLQRPPQPTGQGIIEGTVVNGLTREPIKKAQVVLNGMVSLVAVTDVSGHFAFKDLAAGNYFLDAHAMNFGSRFVRRGPARTQVKLDAGEKTVDTTITLIPNSSIGGRVRDEEGAPMFHCYVSLMEFEQRGERRLVARNNSATSDTGEYRLSNVMPGKYRIAARCNREIPLPHAFIERGPDADFPTETYAPQFYPGAPDLSGAGTIVVAPGVDVSGIDFRMSPVVGLTVRGHVSSDQTETEPQNIRLTLQPRDPQRRPLGENGAGVERTGTFRFRHVIPGSYDLRAFSQGEGTLYYAERPVDVDSKAVMEPVEITMVPVPALTGTLTIEGDSKVPFNNMQVSLNSQDNQFGRGTSAQVQKDGTFAVPGVLPGKWKLWINGIPGYIKSVSLNDQDVVGANLDIPRGGGGKLKVIVGTKWAAVDGTLSSDSTTAGPVTGMLWPDEVNVQQQTQTFGMDEHHHFKVNVAPGHYHACGVTGSQPPWMLLQDATLLKKMESKCVAFEVTEGGRTTIQLPSISSEDLETLSAEEN